MIKIAKPQLLTLFLPFMLAACVAKSGTAEDALLVQEAVIRYQFTHNHAARRDTMNTFCVEQIGEKARADLPPNLMQRLNDGEHRVLSGSSCAKRPLQGVVETETGKPALILRIGAVVWESASSAVVEGGYYEASESASGNLYYLTKVDGVWRVTKDEMAWIS